MESIKFDKLSSVNMWSAVVDEKNNADQGRAKSSEPSSPSGRRTRPLPTSLLFQPVDSAQYEPSRAHSDKNVPTIQSLQIPQSPPRAFSTGALGRKNTGPNPAATFADLCAASTADPKDSTHIFTAKALARVIQDGKEGLKTVFAYDEKDHIAFGSHDELEATKKDSTQHINLLKRVAAALGRNASLDDETRQFGKELFAAGMRGKTADAALVKVGGTRLMQQLDGSLKFTPSEGLGFENVTDAVLEPIARFHANVLCLSGFADCTIKGDGATTEALAKRVGAMLLK